MNDVSTDEVREHLGRILASKEFENSERLRRFLLFSVEAVLTGEQDQVKEYTIGKAVFDRNADYDPRLDPIVRVEARRLRKKLDDYYAGPGQHDAVRILLPKGSYVPDVQRADRSTPAAAEVAPTRYSRRRVAIAAVALGLAAAVTAGYFFSRQQLSSAPAVAVIPARWLWLTEDFPAIAHDEDLAERVATDLARRGRAVAAWPALQRYRGTTADFSAIARQLKVERLLIVAVRVEADGLRVTTYLIDPNLNRKLNVFDRRSAPLHTPQGREQTAAAIAEEFTKRSD